MISERAGLPSELVNNLNNEMRHWSAYPQPICALREVLAAAACGRMPLPRLDFRHPGLLPRDAAALGRIGRVEYPENQVWQGRLGVT